MSLAHVEPSGGAVAVPMRDQIEALKDLIAKDCTPAELELFSRVCERTGLDPFTRQIYAVKRYDSQAGREVMGIQTSIDGFRLIAQRSGVYAGQLGPYWCGSDGAWVDVWLANEAPAAAKVGVLRHGFTEPVWGVARFDAYVQRKKDRNPTRMWSLMPDVMIAKCAESLALRRAFPQELSGIYTSDEMEQASAPIGDAGRPSLVTASSGPTPPPVLPDEPISEANRKAMVEQITLHEASVPDVCLLATNGRTDDPALVYKSDIPAARAALTALVANDPDAIARLAELKSSASPAEEPEPTPAGQGLASEAGGSDPGTRSDPPAPAEDSPAAKRAAQKRFFMVWGTAGYGDLAQEEEDEIRHAWLLDNTGKESLNDLSVDEILSAATALEEQLTLEPQDYAEPIEQGELL